jgi:hypothetical protein
MPRLIVALLCAAILAAADPAAEALAELRAANQARGDLARENAAWTAERQRLEALIAATEAEAKRCSEAAAAAEALAAAARERVAGLGRDSDPAALQARLDAAAGELAIRLRALARQVVPGVLPQTGLDGFEGVVRSLDVAERAAATVTVEVVTGTRDGHAEAVKLLRVSGAGAWWLALDGTSAGTAAMVDGSLMLTSVASAEAIRAAFLQAEGRQAPGVVVLP